MKQSRANISSGIHRLESLLNTQSSNGKHSKANVAETRKGEQGWGKSADHIQTLSA